MSYITDALRAARQGKSYQLDFVTAGGGEFPLLPADKNRIAVIFSQHGATVVDIVFGRQGLAAQGMRLQNASAPVVLNIFEHGGIVQSEIRFATLGIANFSAIAIVAGDE